MCGRCGQKIGNSSEDDAEAGNIAEQRNGRGVRARDGANRNAQATAEHASRVKLLTERETVNASTTAIQSHTQQLPLATSSHASQARRSSAHATILKIRSAEVGENLTMMRYQ